MFVQPLEGPGINVIRGSRDSWRGLDGIIAKYYHRAPQPRGWGVGVRMRLHRKLTPWHMLMPQRCALMCTYDSISAAETPMEPGRNIRKVINSITHVLLVVCGGASRPWLRWTHERTFCSLVIVFRGCDIIILLFVLIFRLCNFMFNAKGALIYERMCLLFTSHVVAKWF